MSNLTTEQLDELAYHLPHVKAWVKAVEAELLRRLRQGDEMENVSLGDTLGNRTWKDDCDPLKILRKFSRLDVIAPRKVLSPTQAEKTLGKSVYAKLAEFVHRPVTAMSKLVFSHPEETERN
jgi:hypothetical protein